MRAIHRKINDQPLIDAVDVSGAVVSKSAPFRPEVTIDDLDGTLVLRTPRSIAFGINQLLLVAAFAATFLIVMVLPPYGRTPVWSLFSVTDYLFFAVLLAPFLIWGVGRALFRYTVRVPRRERFEVRFCQTLLVVHLGAFPAPRAKLQFIAVVVSDSRRSAIIGLFESEREAREWARSSLDVDSVESTRGPSIVAPAGAFLG